MKRFRTTNVVTLASGLLQLTKDQAASRRQNLKEINLSGGIYEIRMPVQFKRGEELGYDGAIPKSLADDLEAIEEEKAKDIIERINACATIAEVDALTTSETRKKVLKVAADKKAALSAELNAESVTVEQIIEEISKVDLETELDLLLAGMDFADLPEEEEKIIRLTAEKRRSEIRDGRK